MTINRWPRRKSIRLPEYDYRQAGLYFVTICASGRQFLFAGPAVRDIVYAAWRDLPNHHAGVDIDEFVVMPNHVHGIILLDGSAAEAQPAASEAGVARRMAPGSLGVIVRSFKSAVSRRVNASQHTHLSRLWQRNYYEHIIRSERALMRIRQYIIDNPARWAFDRDNPDGVPDAEEREFWAEHS